MLQGVSPEGEHGRKYFHVGKPLSETKCSAYGYHLLQVCVRVRVRVCARVCVCARPPPAAWGCSLWYMRLQPRPRPRPRLHLALTPARIPTRIPTHPPPPSP